MPDDAYSGPAYGRGSVVFEAILAGRVPDGVATGDEEEDTVTNERLILELKDALGKLAAFNTEIRQAIDLLEIGRLSGLVGEAIEALGVVPGTGPWMAWPLDSKSRVINSGFGQERAAFTHEGVDFFAPLGTTVLAPADGTVERVYTGKFYGIAVVTRHARGGVVYMAYHAHLGKAMVEVGDAVRRGQPIAKTGNTGNSSGPHYHQTLVEEGNPTKLRGISLLGCVDPAPHILMG
jgi:murein DD-endopeptidase MepM/ murein hydrolase activator NlpD